MKETACDEIRIEDLIQILPGRGDADPDETCPESISELNALYPVFIIIPVLNAH